MMTTEEKFEKLRRCVAFGSATSPYVLTDPEEDELYNFLEELDDIYSNWTPEDEDA